MDDPTPRKQALQRLTTVKKDAAVRHTTMGGSGFNPLAQDDAPLFRILCGKSTLMRAAP